MAFKQKSEPEWKWSSVRWVEGWDWALYIDQDGQLDSATKEAFQS